MKFNLVDQVVSFEPGKSLSATKAVSRGEEYLADHFPTFPVLPGVFMLQILVESASWLVRASRDFAESMVLLKEARNVSYKSFVTPGNILRAEVTCSRMAPGESDFVGVGRCDEVEVVKGRFSLIHYNLADRQPEGSCLDRRMIEAARREWALLNVTPVLNR